MQNYYIRIEDMPSLISHQLSIIKYVVLKKIFFFLCFDRLIWTWTWTWTRTSLDSDLTRTRTSLDLDLSWTRQRWTWLQPYPLAPAPWMGRGGSRWPTPGGSSRFTTSNVHKTDLCAEVEPVHRMLFLWLWGPRRCSIRAMLSFLQQMLERRLPTPPLKVYVAAIPPTTTP